MADPAQARSLRLRLTVIILVPLLLVAVAVSIWQVSEARQTASEVFDRSLLSAALSVTNDVALSGGDALSPATRRILSDTSGGNVFYHVYAPDGVIVAGYATPPVGVPATVEDTAGITYFNGEYLGRSVRGVRTRTRTQIEGFNGIFTTTVWQDVQVRESFLAALTNRSLLAIGGLILALTLIVWFGIRIGLRPLLELRRAIDLRSGDDLTAIKRPVPTELRGTVETLNRLFGQVSRTMTAQKDFISNAAHQLRNPIAAILVLAESVRSAPDDETARERAADLVEAACNARDLAARLLAYERAKAMSPAELKQKFSLNMLVHAITDNFRHQCPQHVHIDLNVPDETIGIFGDRTMLGEALTNLLDNSIRHGGETLSRITVTLERDGKRAVLSVCDNGRGLSATDLPRALERFGQVEEGDGSGLGLPIITEIARGHGGRLDLKPIEQGLQATISLPAG